MRNRATRWLAFLAIIALGIVGALWLVKEHDAATRQAARGLAGPVDATMSPAKESVPVGASGATVQNNAQSNAQSNARGNTPSQGASAAPSSPLQLDFQLPANTKMGDAFDLNVTINTRVPIQRLTFEIEFDQRLVRPRTLEEFDYTNRPPNMRTFVAEPMSDERVSVTLSFGAGTPGSLPSLTAAVAQFEALASGPAQINIARISAVDRSGGPVAFTASGQQSRIEINPN